jgi:ribosomal-protein-alanine N-acetyltransferase
MRLETERLVLRELTEDDLPAVLAYQQTPEYERLRDRDSYTLDDARELVGTFIAWQTETPRLRIQLAIDLKLDSRLIGTCGIRRQRPGDVEADLGYELAPAFWSRGYATEAAARMVSFAFLELGLRRVAAWCHVDNTGSIRVLEKLGMCREAITGDADSSFERWRNYYRFALAAPE